MSYTRTFKFKTDTTIPDPITVMLIFGLPPKATPNMKQVAWKILEFGGPGQTAQAVYAANINFTAPQVASGKVIQGGTSQVLGLGQQTTLDKKGGGVAFSPPTAGLEGLVTVTNNTGNYRTIGVGFQETGGDAQTALVWEDVGNANMVQAEFTPVINVYITSNYQENEIIKGIIVSPILKEILVNELKSDPVYKISKLQNTQGCTFKFGIVSRCFVYGVE